MSTTSCKVCGALRQKTGEPCTDCSAVVPATSTVELQRQARDPNFTTNRAKRDAEPPGAGPSTSRI